MERLFSQVRCQDVIQLALRSDDIMKPVSVMLNTEDSVDLSGFQALLDQLVQSNMLVTKGCLLELIVQLICSP